ncbi:MAG: hypothetical protein ACI8QS_001620 [Planctomycetota bacterium]|jgi:uncharacterized protein (TIGR00730 family)
MTAPIRRLCVFCGAHVGTKPLFAEIARETGRLVAERGWALVTGGGGTGLMGAVAEGALAAGGEVIGVIPKQLEERELAHRGLTELHTVESMHSRKELMHSLSQAFVTLPGGMGSLDEVFEALTWAQLGLHAKPVGFVSVEGFWDPLLAQLDQCVEQGFLKPEQRGRILVASAPGPLLEAMDSWEPPAPLWS